MTRRRKPPLYARWANPRGYRVVAARMQGSPWRRGQFVGYPSPTFSFVTYQDQPAALPRGNAS